MFAMGDRVVKDAGDYVFEGVIISVFHKRSGAVRFVVEDDRGLCFIFNAAQLRRVDTPKVA